MKRYSLILSLGLLATGLSSCLKDDLVSDQTYGMINTDAYKIAQLPAATKSLALQLENKVSIVDFVDVNLAMNDVADEDITVTLSTDDSDVDIAAYNTANGKSVVKFPASKFTLPNGLKVTVPKGSRTGSLKLSVNASDLDLLHPYALSFKIASVSKGDIAIGGNFKKTIVIIAAKNNWDGIYSMRPGSTVQRYSAPGVPTVGDALNGSLAANADLSLSTINANTVEIANLRWFGNTSGIGGIDNLQAIVDPVTNLVTMKAVGNLTLKNIPGKDNKYDPATKTFTLNFDWNQATAPRAVSLIIRYKASR